MENTSFDLLGMKHHEGLDNDKKPFSSYKILIMRAITNYDFNGGKGGGSGFEVSEQSVTKEIFDRIYKPDMVCLGKKVSFIHDVVPAKGKGFTTIIKDAKIN